MGVAVSKGDSVIKSIKNKKNIGKNVVSKLLYNRYPKYFMDSVMRKKPNIPNSRKIVIN